jgi:hypothetical protein
MKYYGDQIKEICSPQGSQEMHTKFKLGGGNLKLET